MSASTVGQTTGPPAENEYAVEPVGVEKHAVAPERRDGSFVDTDDDLDHAFARQFFDARLVECPRFEHCLVVEFDGDIEREPLVDRVVLGNDSGDNGFEVLDLQLGEEADVSHVDPENRCRRVARDFRGLEDCPVTTEANDEFDVGDLNA